MLFDDPTTIRGRNSQYDDWYEGFDNNSDYFIVEIDSRHDHQTSYCFAVNSLGVKADYMIYDDDPEKIDDEWNERWDAKVSRSNNGWMIEYSIPLRILRYSNNTDMGINFIRYIKNSNEYISWLALPRETKGVVSHYGHINNLIISPSKYLSVKPYVLSGDTYYNDNYYPDFDEDLVELDSVSNNKKVGINLKYLIDNHSSLEIVFNPDFGQIEQDPSEINLTGYETYFEEKRKFFIENSSLFITPIDIFYSRRIGGEITLDNKNYLTKLNSALKVTGKNQDGTSYGILLSQSDYCIPNTSNIPEQIRGLKDNIYSSILRVSQDILDGNSYVGILNTNYNNGVNKSNVFALDGLIYFDNNRFELDGQLAFSSLNSNNGIGANFEIGYRGKIKESQKNKLLNNKIIESWVNFEMYDQEFDISKLGFLNRNNLQKIGLGIAIIQEENNYLFNRYSLSTDLLYAQNLDGNKLINQSSLNWKSVFSNYWSFNSGISFSTAHYNDRLYDYYHNSIQTKIVKIPKSNEYYFTFSSPPMNPFSFTLSTGFYKNDLLDKRNQIHLSTLLKPSTWLNIEATYEVTRGNETYHFLMVREPHEGIERNFNEPFYSLLDDQQYLFTSSDNSGQSIILHTTSYLKNNISLQLYLEYFSNKSIFGESYWILENDLEYPSLEQNMNHLGDIDDINLKYRANYCSAIVNYVFKWEFKQNSNLYLVYSYYKEVNGKNIGFKDIINYKYNEAEPVEIFLDHSIFIRCDFWLDI